jgi:Protein of unknown function (DUF4231)
MQAEDYLTQRLQAETDWYDQRAGANKRYYVMYSVGAVVASAAVPVSIAAALDNWIPAALGGAVSVATAMLSILKCQENWQHYRSTAEILKKERYLYELRAGPYADLDEQETLAQLVERVEGMISVEHRTWHQTQRQPRSPTTS